MKKKIQALACAAILAVGGFNVYTAMDSVSNTAELEFTDIEASAIEIENPIKNGQYGDNIYWKFITNYKDWSHDTWYAYYNCVRGERSQNPIQECTLNQSMAVAYDGSYVRFF